MPESRSVVDILLPLAAPILICASGVYAALDCAWRRRRRARGHFATDVYPGSVRQHLDRLRGREAALEDAIQIELAARAHFLARVEGPGGLEERLQAMAEADRIVAEAHDRLAGLYEQPTLTRR
ncbi:hypothetical protein ACFW9D_05725 [Streptomyces sp. NPDC059524]|uniref:hypothetical protein n=1 Tax=Streptomyces sp. NPDC059524 TaxID=3346856 RepID=UPI0036BDF8C6